MTAFIRFYNKYRQFLQNKCCYFVKKIKDQQLVYTSKYNYVFVFIFFVNLLGAVRHINV